MTFKVGSKVRHSVYGVGVVLEAWRGERDSENYAIKFKKGGPLGWAQNSTNDIKNLKAVK
jgi:hypothetical protein